ncbi:MAG TPA: porin [Pirellulales bacterium]|nr:porin [Pirellulales bacterium]
MPAPGASLLARPEDRLSAIAQSGGTAAAPGPGTVLRTTALLQQNPADQRPGPSGALDPFAPADTGRSNNPLDISNQVQSLRTALDKTIERLGATERQLQATQQRLDSQTNGEIAPTGLPQRMTDLESAWDRFEDQLAAERGAKYPSAKLTGFTQLDDYMMSQDQLNKDTVGNGQNGLGFRRARLAVIGNVSTFTAYMMEVDFATAGRPSFFDMWVEQDNLPILRSVRIGQYLQPFSVDAMSGFRHLPFLERSLPFLAFVPFRRVGAMASNNSRDELTYWAYSFFRTGGFNNAPEGDSRFATDIGDQGGLSFSTRITHLLQYDPHADDRYLWDVGVSYNYSRMTGNTASGQRPFYQARTGPEFGPIGDGIDTIPATFGAASYNASNFTPPQFIDSGRFLADSFNLFGVETLYQNGAFSAQGEFMATGVNSVVGPIWYTGAYGEVMYRLTGEHRGYDKRLAAFKNPVPFTDFISLKPGGIKGWGSWEIAARLSYVEMRNPSSLTAADYISGTNATGNGTLTDVTVGLTWLLNYHTKLQFNWIHAMLNNRQMGFSVADNSVSRIQVDF